MFVSHSNTLKNNRIIVKADMFLIFSKAFFLLFLLYYGWFQRVFFHIPNMSFFLGAGMILFILLHSLLNRISLFNSITSELLLWSLFLITAFIFGIMVAVNKGNLYESVSTFFQHLVMIFGMVYVSSREKKIDSFINIYILFALICAITTVFFGVYVSSTRMSMSAVTNPNTLGISMVIGAFCVLYKLDFKKTIPTLLQFGELLLFFYVMILSGSRKAFLSAAILLVFWFFFVRKDTFRAAKRHNIRNRVILILGTVAGAYLFYVFVSDMPIFLRLERLFESGDNTRVSMYMTAFELFKQSPFVGIGLDNYRSVTAFNTYSHSTYAEALACTGIIGSVLYFSPYLILIKKTRALIKSDNLDIIRITKLLSVLLFVFFFLGTGIIHFYDVNSSITFGFIIAFCNLYYKNIYLKRRIRIE